MSDLAEYSYAQLGPDGGKLLLSGSYRVSSLSCVDSDLRACEHPIREIDISGVSDVDTVGAWYIRSLSLRLNAQVTGANEMAARLISAAEVASKRAGEPESNFRHLREIFANFGKFVVDALWGTVQTVGFFGRFLAAFGRLLRRPSRFRWRALILQMQNVGVSALPIVGLMSFVVGIVIAQQGAVQLAQFGAEGLTVNLVGRITLRELGIVMTAIMVAGRSGSAFAAQIGTMKLTEEVDAMRTIGLGPVEVLVVPRVLATVIMMPLLCFYASAIAIVGGAFIGDTLLNIPFWTFISRIRDVVPIYDLWVGLIKAPVFGAIIALSGCYHGMQVENNSEEVGRRTTLAVVSAIFAVNVLDAIFAVFFTALGWG